MERLLINWFLRAEGSDLTDEALRDKDTMGDDDTVDAAQLRLIWESETALAARFDGPDGGHCPVVTWAVLLYPEEVRLSNARMR